MKTKLLLFALAPALLFTICMHAQNNLIVFSQDGYKFTLIINGLKQNDSPQTNVKVTGLNAQNYKARVIFENTALATLDQQVYLMDGGNPVSNQEFSYSITNTKKGMKLRFQSMAPIPAQTTTTPDQVVYQFNPSGDATYVSGATTTTTTTGTGVSTGVSAGGTTATSSVTTTGDPATGGSVSTTVNDGMGGTTTTTTTTTTSSNGANVGVNAGGVGVNINITGMDGGMGTTSSITTTTTTSSSSSSTSTGGMSSTTTGGTTGATANTTSSSSTQCYYPMSDGDFSKAKASVDAQSFEEQKLKVAKQVLNTNCMSTTQIKDIMGEFSFEQTKVDWAKFAYGKVTDPQNYYQLNDAFSFSSSVDDLNNYIEQHKH